MVHEKMPIFEGQSSRDDFLTMDDIANIDRKIKTLRCMFHSSDSLSVQQWVPANTDKWFAYQEYSAIVDGDGEVPFVLGIQLPEQPPQHIGHGFYIWYECHEVSIVCNDCIRLEAYGGASGMGHYV
ncbi:hypothetical protein SUGI_0461150 [Cryptomeria japonica]|nr:hypothetical protein SUGI_0461150 [Cryptomeria japonica]